jgi:gluconate 2-dehydrogenase gamma chain
LGIEIHAKLATEARVRDPGLDGARYVDVSNRLSWDRQIRGRSTDGKRKEGGMEEPVPGLPSRREFLRVSGGAMGWTMLASRFPSAAQAAARARRMAAGDLPGVLGFLTEAEAAEVEEISALLIPTDDTPGAREAGAVYFIDGALMEFMSSWAAAFRAGLATFASRLEQEHPGAASIADLDEEAANEFLRSVEDTPFFGLCWTLTVWGTLADPAYGGNRDRVGWSMVGFEDRHAWHPPFGHYDADSHGGGE